MEDGVISKKHEFSAYLMKDIISCALKSQDIELVYLKQLERIHDEL